MKGLVSVVATLADYLLRDVVSAPRLCDGCGRTFTRLTRAQCAQIVAGERASCRRRGCGGRLRAATYSDAPRPVSSTAGDPS